MQTAPYAISIVTVFRAAFACSTKKDIRGAPDPVNSYGNISHLNVQASWEWYRDNLDFSFSDVQERFGEFARARGTMNHHTIYWLRADLPFPRLDG